MLRLDLKLDSIEETKLWNKYAYKPILIKNRHDKYFIKNLKYTSSTVDIYYVYLPAKPVAPTAKRGKSRFLSKQ